MSKLSNDGKIGRNDLCPCGSGKKYKKCCLNASPDSQCGANLSPSQLVEARVKAFQQNDFGFIYDTFHNDSNFRLQFPQRSQYLAYGLSTLDADYKIDQCRIIEQQVDGQSAQVLFYLQVSYHEQQDDYFELSEFELVEQCWRYLQSYKLPCSEFDGCIEDITMAYLRQAGTCF